MSEDKDKKPEDFTIPELLEMLEEVTATKDEYQAEIDRLRKEIEKNQNE